LRLTPYDDVSMRERFTYRGDSLWWFTELYLHKMRRVGHGNLDDPGSSRSRPPTIRCGRWRRPIRTIRAAALAFADTTGTPVEVGGHDAPRRRLGWPSFTIGFNARLSRLRSARAIVDRQSGRRAFVHTAFWRPTGGESDGLCAGELCRRGPQRRGQKWVANKICTRVGVGPAEISRADGGSGHSRQQRIRG
jgi:hypothetical protein